MVRSALAARRGRDDCLQALPLPHTAKQLQLPGESPGRDTPRGVCRLLVEEKVWRPIFLSACLPARCSYVRWQGPDVGSGIQWESLRAPGRTDRAWGLVEEYRLCAEMTSSFSASSRKL